MKVAIVGKGGVGKTTFAAMLSRRAARAGTRVIAVDADPDGNLPAALGVAAHEVPEPIAHMRDLILERTESRNEGGSIFYKLNPKVDDLPGAYSVDSEGVRLLVLGTVETGGKGCMCPEGSVLKALLQHLLLIVPEDVVLDMEAGLEHMGRASAAGTDALIAVVEPGMRSVQTARHVVKLASDIGIRRVGIVGNKIRSAREEDVLREALADQTILGFLPFSEALASADLAGRSVDIEDDALSEAFERVCRELEHTLEQDAKRTTGA